MSESFVQHEDGVVRIRVTTYHPRGRDAPDFRMEGGFGSAVGKRVIPFEEAHKHTVPGLGPVFTVAADPVTMPYWSVWKIHGLDEAYAVVMDTGGHFFGKDKRVRHEGHEPVDIATYLPHISSRTGRLSTARRVNISPETVRKAIVMSDTPTQQEVDAAVRSLREYHAAHPTETFVTLEAINAARKNIGQKPLTLSGPMQTSIRNMPVSYQGGGGSGGALAAELLVSLIFERDLSGATHARPWVTEVGKWFVDRWRDATAPGPNTEIQLPRPDVAVPQALPAPSGNGGGGGRIGRGDLVAMTPEGGRPRIPYLENLAGQREIMDWIDDPKAARVRDACVHICNSKMNPMERPVVDRFFQALYPNMTPASRNAAVRAGLLLAIKAGDNCEFIATLTWWWLQYNP